MLRRLGPIEPDLATEEYLAFNLLAGGLRIRQLAHCDKAKAPCPSRIKVSRKRNVTNGANGFEQVSNVAGGIVAWAEQIDPSLPR